MQEGVRSCATTDKVAVHSSTYGDDLSETIKQLRQNQELQQQQLNECIVSMNQLASNLSSQVRLNKCIVSMNQIASKSSSQVGGRPKPKGIPKIIRNCWFHGTTSHSILECTGFQNLDNNSKYKLLRSKRVCFVCLRKGHFSSDCRN